MDDIRKLVVKSVNGTPVRIQDIAHVELPDERRGFTELNGEGEVASGIVVARSGENALNVIEQVKTKLQSLKASYSKGTEVVPVYDRSDLSDVEL